MSGAVARLRRSESTWNRSLPEQDYGRRCEWALVVSDEVYLGYRKSRAVMDCVFNDEPVARALLYSHQTDTVRLRAALPCSASG